MPEDKFEEMQNKLESMAGSLIKFCHNPQLLKQAADMIRDLAAEVDSLNIEIYDLSESLSEAEELIASLEQTLADED
jgi:hypothetical protein